MQTRDNHDLSPARCSNERAEVRRVLPDECFESASSWKIPPTFNEAASGFSPEHAPGVVPTDEPDEVERGVCTRPVGNSDT